MRHLIAFLTIAAISIFFYACFPAKKVSATPSKQTFTYDYKPPGAAAPNSAGMLVTLVKPSFAVRFANAGSDVFENFRNGMENDIQELLIDKGYTIKSTYQTFDNMTYDEKKSVDVALQIEIDPTFTAGQGGWHEYHPFSLNGPSPAEYGFIGTVSLIGKINITGKEPLSHEIIWLKSIPIPSITDINISTYYHYDNTQFTKQFFDDPNVYNALGLALEQQYKGIMQQIDTYLDPREFADLKPQIKELKAKKTF